MVQNFCDADYRRWQAGKNGWRDYRYHGFEEKTESLRRAVNLDSFTGLYNKDHTIALINNILDMGTHVKHALVILDIDNFKKFNDTYGHDQGDKIH